MLRSLNEITVEIRKALVGAGYPVGIAEDASRAAAALQCAGFDAVDAVIGLLPEADEASPPAGIADLLAGFDRAYSGSQPVEIASVTTPVFFFGLGMHLAGSYRCGFKVACDAGEWDITHGSVKGPDPALMTGQVKIVADKSARHVPVPPPDGCRIDEERWPIVQRWAKRTYVPSTEDSRLKGAGAGLNDND